jgi:hypothetical protein
MDISWCKRGTAVLTLVLLWCSGCQATRQEGKETLETPAAAGQGQGNFGYALLYQLMGDEQNVSKLLLVKREREELNTLVKSISKAAGDAHKQLEVFGKADSSLNLKANGLPREEVAARESISKAKAKELLTGKGKNFELSLLLSQNEALTYAEHLALTLAIKGSFCGS